MFDYPMADQNAKEQVAAFAAAQAANLAVNLTANNGVNQAPQNLNLTLRELLLHAMSIATHYISLWVL